MKKLPQDAKSIFKYFDGKWTISRDIKNLFAPHYNGKAEGTLKITHTPKELLNYSEEVKVKFANGFEANGAQDYIFQLNKEKLSQYRAKSRGEKELEKMYDLTFIPNKGRLLAKNEYKCGKDLYKVEYSINDYNNFSIYYTVIGPEKNYSTQTSFIREEAEIDLAGDVN